MNWRLFFVLWGASAFSIVVTLVVTFGDSPRWTPGYLVLVVPLLLAFIIVIAVPAPFIIVGLAAAKRTGLGAPILESWIAHRRMEGDVRILISGLLIGATAGLILRALVFRLGLPIIGADFGEPQSTAYFTALNALSSINDELIFRLGLMSIVVWLTTRLRTTPIAVPTLVAVGIAIAISAMANELAYAALRGTSSNPIAPIKFSLRGITTLMAFMLGWMYWKFGLEASILGHFSFNVFYRRASLFDEFLIDT